MKVPVMNKALKIAIYASGFNQRQFAFAMGVSSTLVSNIVNGFKRPTEEFMQKSALILNRKISDLFPEDNNES